MPSAAWQGAADQLIHFKPTVLCKIVFTAPSAKTILLAEAPVTIPDTGEHWEFGILSCEDIRDVLRYGGGLSDPTTCSIRLANRRIAQLGGADRLGTMLSAYDYRSAIVTLFYWFEGMEDADLQPVFSGTVNWPKVERTAVTLYLMQSRVWNADLPREAIDLASYPNSIQHGIPKPLVMGEWRALNLHAPPFTTPFGLKPNHEDAGAGGGVIPGLLVDPGTGNDDAKVLYAGHECLNLIDRANGFSQFMRGSNLLNPLDTAGLTEVLGASESAVVVDDEALQVFAAVIPIDVRLTSANPVNTAGDPKNAMRVFDDRNYAVLDQGAGKTRLQLMLPNLTPLGYIESVEVQIAFSGDVANDRSLQAYPYNPDTNASGSKPSAASNVATIGMLAGTWDGSWWTRQWDFGGNTGGSSVVDLRVDFVSGGAGANKARIYWAVLVVKYRPARAVVVPALQAKAVQDVFGPGGRRETRTDARSGTIVRFRAYEASPAVYNLAGDFYANVRGQPDDVGGTFTGSGGALIQQAPDIARYLLNEYGGVDLADIEDGAEDFGSFVRARGLCRDGSVDDWNSALYVSEFTDLATVLRALCDQALMAVRVNRFTGKWQCLPWRIAPRPDFARRLSWARKDLLEVSAEMTSDTEIQNAYRVRYRWDFYRNNAVLEAFLNAASSSPGFTNPGSLDQELRITSSTNKLRWEGVTDTLASALYATPIDLAAEIRTQMRTHDGQMHVGHGFWIATGFNDSLIFGIPSGPTPTITIPPGWYSGHSLAMRVERLMNEIQALRVFSVTYSDTTNKFTFSATGGNFTLKGDDVNYLTSTLAVMGIITQTSSAATYTAPLPRYGDRFWWLSKSAGSLSFDNTVANTCAPVIGMQVGLTYNPNPGTRVAHSEISTGHRIGLAATSRAYKKGREVAIDAQTIRNEAVAIMLRNRLFDMTARPRVVLRFKSTRCASLETGRIVTFDDSMDDVLPYPDRTDEPTWQDRTFVVLEVLQRMRRARYQEVLALET